MKTKNYLKRVVATLLAVALILPIGGVGKFEATSGRLKIKTYRSISGTLIEWTAPTNASKYIVYRKTGNKKNKNFGKWTVIETINETYFLDKNCNNLGNRLNRRWCIDPYDNRGDIKGCRIVKHGYKYKVKVVNDDNTSITSNTQLVKKCNYLSKKYNKKILANYGELYWTNKERVEEGLTPLRWGHAYKKGSKIRARDLDFKFEHERPKNRVSKKLKKKYGLSIKSAFDKFLKKQIWFVTENASEGYSDYGKTTKKLKNDYMNSPGHKAAILRDYGVDGVYISYLSYKRAHEISTFIIEQESKTRKTGGFLTQIKTNSETKVDNNPNTTKVINKNLINSASGLFASIMTGINLSNNATNEEIETLFESYKNSGQLAEAISKLGETKTYEFFKEYITKNLFDTSKVDERGDWLYRIGKLLS